MGRFLTSRSAGLFVMLPILTLSIGCPPKLVDNGGTPPTPKSGEGVIAFVTVDDTSLTVGQTTTARLWVQQSSPNAANDNGIFSVAVNIVAAPAGLVKSQVPVTILSVWSNPIPAAITGTANAEGGIDKVTAGVSIMATDKTEGISGPVEVFNFPVNAVAAGTATLTPTNFIGAGFVGVIDYKAQVGDESNYESVSIVVTP